MADEFILRPTLRHGASTPSGEALKNYELGYVEDGTLYIRDGNGKYILLNPKIDLSSYLTSEKAKQTYLPLSGGTIKGDLTINGSLTGYSTDNSLPSPFIINGSTGIKLYTGLSALQIGRYINKDILGTISLIEDNHFSLDKLTVNDLIINNPTMGINMSYPLISMNANSDGCHTIYYSSIYSTSYDAYKAFTHSVSKNGWASSSGNKGQLAWLCIDLGENNLTKVNIIEIWNRTHESGAFGPTQIDLYGGSIAPTNGSGAIVAGIPASYSKISTFTRSDGATNGLKSKHYIGATEAYRYILFAFTNWDNYANSFCAVGQIRINGKTLLV